MTPREGSATLLPSSPSGIAEEPTMYPRMPSHCSRANLSRSSILMDEASGVVETSPNDFFDPLPSKACLSDLAKFSVS